MSKVKIPFDKEAALTDWKTGEFTERSLAAKYKISVGTAHNLVTGVPKDLEPLIARQVSIKQELIKFSRQEVSKFEQVVCEKSADLAFYRASSNLISDIALQKVVEKKTESTMMELKMAQEVIGKGKENVYGKPGADVAVQINNTVSAGEMSRADLMAIAAGKD